MSNKAFNALLTPFWYDALVAVAVELQKIKQQGRAASRVPASDERVPIGAGGILFVRVASFAHLATMGKGTERTSELLTSLIRQAKQEQLPVHLLHHAWSGELFREGSGDPAMLFARAAGVPNAAVLRVDLGWRPTPSPTVEGRQRQRLRFMAALPRALATVRRINPNIILSGHEDWDCQAATYLASRLKCPQVLVVSAVPGSHWTRPVLKRTLTCDYILAADAVIETCVVDLGVPVVRVQNLETLRDKATDPQILSEIIRFVAG